MKYKHSHFIVLISLLTIVTSCFSPKKEYILKVALLKLDEADMYNTDMVYDVIFDAEENNIDSLKEKSRKLFLEGIDIFKNEKRPSAAVDYFKKSILVFPDAKTYYELGSALMESNNLANLEEALKSLSVAEHLNFQPTSTIYYKKACINSIIYNEYSFTEENKRRQLNKSIYLLQKAFSSGFVDTITLQSDTRMKAVLSSKEYEKMMLEMLSHNNKNDSNAFFYSFKKSFSSPKESFEIPLDNIEMRNYRESISYDYAKFISEMENVSFGRDVSHDFYYVANVGETSNYTALIYSSINFNEGEMQPVYTTLATFDNTGLLIDKKLFSCQCSAEKIKQGLVHQNDITIRDYKRVWEKPIDKVPFEENQVKEYLLVAEAKFTINDSGKIINEDVTPSLKDTTISIK